MFSLRTHVLICLGLFAALIGVAILGTVLQAQGMKPPEGAAAAVALSCYFALFVAAGLSAVPVMWMLVLGAQERLGNHGAPVIGGMIRHQTHIVWAIWALIAAGTVVALPAMVWSGFFGVGPQTTIQHTVGRAAEGPDLGTLVARPDMPVATMVSQSTLPLDTSYASTAIAGGGVFDFQVAGTGLRFAHVRYYFITTYANDSGRVRSMSIGTSPGRMPAAAIDAADRAVRARLVQDGWQAGHEVYRDAQDRALHGGAAQGPEGRDWLKDGMVLSIERKRMDAKKPGEASGAGEWIQFIELWPLKEMPNADRLVFRTPDTP